MYTLTRIGALASIVLIAIATMAAAQDTNPLFRESKIKNYVPHKNLEKGSFVKMHAAHVGWGFAASC